ncbi:MAG: nitroreductase family protein [Candidatus Hodarchaeota archaeon]
MPIIGIDEDKCTSCFECGRSCPALLFKKEGDTVSYQGKGRICILCGHCIAVCPEDAILYKNMKDEPASFDGVEDPKTIISYDDIYKFTRAKRSIRRFKSTPVPQELLEKVFEVIRYAPSGSNMRKCKFHLVSDQETLKTLSSSILEAFMANPNVRMMYGNLLVSVNKKGLPDPIFRGAPHVIFASSILPGPTPLNNAGISLTYGMLAAQSLGLATCWIGFAQAGFFMNTDLLKLVGIKGKCTGAMAIGYPAVKYHRCPPRAPLKVKGLK